jgi:MFS transporter, DHA1 family, multidrug resistance protein
MKKNSLFLPSIVSLSLLAPLMAELYTPSFLLIIKEYEISPSLMSLSLTLFFLSFALGQLIYGPLSETIGRRSPLLIGLIFSLIGTSLICISKSQAVFLVGRIIQGFGISATLVLQKAILRDRYCGDSLSHALSYAMVYTMIVANCNPLLGSLFVKYLDWRSVFYFLNILNFLILITVFYFVTETKPKEERAPLCFKKTFGHFGHLLSNFLFVGYVLCAILPPLGGLTFYAITPFIFADLLSADPIQYGLLVSTPVFGLIVGLKIHKSLLKNLGRHRTLTIGNYVLSLGALLFLLTAFLPISNYWLVIPFGIYNLGGAWIQPNAMAAALTTFPQLSGYASSLYGAIRMFFTSIAIGSLSVVSSSGTTTHGDSLPLGIAFVLVGFFCISLQHFLFKQAHI